MELRRRLLTTTFIGGAVSSTCSKVDVHGLEVVAVTKMVDECVGRSTREERVLQLKVLDDCFERSLVRKGFCK